MPNALRSAAVLASVEVAAVENDQLAGLGLGRKRMLERQRADLLGKIDGVAARLGTEGTTAAAELRSRRGAVTGDAAALLLAELLGGQAISPRCLTSWVPAMRLELLVAHHAVQDVGARLEAEHVVRRG